MSIVSLVGIMPGDLFTKSGSDVWRVKWYCQSPTITLENVETGDRVDAGVGALLLEDFVPLVRHPGGKALEHIPAPLGVRFP